MMQVASHYALILHDANLRSTLISGERPRTAASRTPIYVYLRCAVAKRLRTLAARVEPQGLVFAAAGRQQPA
jgi:hypothetical protein